MPVEIKEYIGNEPKITKDSKDKKKSTSKKKEVKKTNAEENKNK